MKRPTQQRDTIVVGADDELVVDELLGALTQDHDLHIVRSGEEVREAVRSEPLPSLILLERSVRGVTVHELCRSLRSGARSGLIPVLLLREASSPESEASGLAAGASDHVTRPFEVQTLRARVRTQLELSRLRALTREALLVDPLTGLPHQRRITETLEGEWGRAAREAMPLSFILVKVDRWSHLVEREGMPAAEARLVRIADELATAIQRPMDVLGRFEDGFALVLPTTDAHGAAYLAEKMREQVEALSMSDVAGSGFERITVSLGVASAMPMPGSTSPPLLKAARQGLEAAARRGGNCVRRILPDTGE